MLRRRDIVRHMIEVFIIVILSFVVWSNFNNDENAKIAASYSNRNIAMTFDGFKTITSMSNNDYESLKAEQLYLRNISDKEDSYELYYVYSTTSSVSYKTIKLALDNQLYDLSDMPYTIEGDYYLFFLKEGAIDPYTTITFDTRIWTTSLNGELTSNFITK